jgi:hypothetical protein
MLDMRAKKSNVFFNRKDSFPFRWFVYDEDGELLDFTGGAVVLTVNANEDGTGSDLFTLNPTNTLSSDGILRFKPSVANNDQAPGRYFFDVEFTNAAGDIRTIIKGHWVIDYHISN